jgi:hypothetical protein
LHRFIIRLADNLKIGPALAIAVIAFCVFLDILSLYWWLRRNKRERGPSGIPLIPWIFYMIIAIFSREPFPFVIGQGVMLNTISRFFNIVILTAFHVACQFAIPRAHLKWLEHQKRIRRI